MLKVDKEKKQAKEEWAKKQETKKKRRVSAKALPYFSKERVFERELKIIAVDESWVISRQIHEQVQLAREWAEPRESWEG